MLNPFLSDARLARRCVRGSPEAFNLLHARHVERVYRVLRQLTGDTQEAEDLTQETFVAAFRALPGWRGEGAFSTWLCAIAYRQYANRRRTRADDPVLIDDWEGLPAPDQDPLAHCTRQEQAERIERAIAALPDVLREPFVLVKVEGLSYREAAGLLDVPIGTVQSRLWRATRTLQTALADDNPHVVRSVARTDSVTQTSSAIPNGSDNSTLCRLVPQGEPTHALRNRA